MGVIYQAEDPDIGRTVAIKLVRADLLEREDRDEFLARFRHEARAAGRCMHPNIVAIYDFALHEGNPFLAMEYIDGVGLGQALKGVGRFAPAEAVALTSQMLEALNVAHGLGIVHRDVKPANILLLPSGQVKMTDFGISRMNTSDITQDGAIIGTPAYMSPEQCRGDTVDARSDLFSVGTVLYELLTGTRAFSGRNATEVTYQVLTVEPPELAQVVEDVPPSLAAVLRQAMAKSRDARFASARTMVDALQAAMRMGGVAPAPDQTVVMPRSAFEPIARAAIDDATLDTIERRLARHIGPIARRLVREAARKTDSVEALCQTLSRNISQTAEREKFLSEGLDGSLSRATGMTSVRSSVQRPASTSVGSGSVVAGTIAAEQIERAERALTKALGPIAKVMVKRALPGVTSEAALWERLATHIQRPADREAFLRSRPGG
jgi:serine/threonine-protein kinase